MEKSTQIDLKLSVEEINTVLEALGQMPFVRVFSLIENLQQQASRQLSRANSEPNGLKLEPEPQPQ